MTGPRPGPTLAKALPAPLAAVMKSSPKALSSTDRLIKQMKKTKKNVITAELTESGMGLWL